MIVFWGHLPLNFDKNCYFYPQIIAAMMFVSLLFLPLFLTRIILDVWMHQGLIIFSPLRPYERILCWDVVINGLLHLYTIAFERCNQCNRAR